MRNITLIFACALAIRFFMFPLPYSTGPKRPWGDMEAHRNWMHVTTSVPLHAWYVDALGNRLEYWGLDYPPLFAYASWAFGALAQRLLPVLLENENYVTLGARAFMRGTVVALEAVTLFPAARLLAGALPPLPAARAAIPTLALLMHPALLLIDHAHFQYNGAAIGAALASAALAFSRPLVAALLFTLALNLKHTTLYYAPAFLVALAAVAWRGGLPGVLGGGTAAPQPPLLSRAAGVAALGAVVAATVALLWAPFCATTPAQEGGCWGGLAAVARRLVPLGRGVWEDYVSNLWCALEPLVQARARMRKGQLDERALAAFAVAASAGALGLALPSLALLWARVASGGDAKGAPSRLQHLLLALHAVSLAFFLASFQVHEKAILLPALPLALLAPQLPAAAAAFAAAATWSMWPLLARDGLVWPALVLAGAYVVALPAAAGGGEEAAALSVALRVLGVPVGEAAALRLLRGAAALGAFLAAAVSAGRMLHPMDPSSLPHLWEFLSAALAAAAFLCFLALAAAIQLAWTARALAGADAVTRNATAGAGGEEKVRGASSRSQSKKKKA
jgi:alpha-1,3-glucosyltransferase